MFRVLLFSLMATSVFGQTVINGSRTITGNWDASQSTGYTKPFRVVLAAPSGACSNAAAVEIFGSQVWGCIGGVWIQINAGAGLADPGANGIIKRTAANTTAPAVAGTDYVVPAGNVATATDIFGAPGNNQYYGTNGSAVKGFYPLPSGGAATDASQLTTCKVSYSALVVTIGATSSPSTPCIAGGLRVTSPATATLSSLTTGQLYISATPSGLLVGNNSAGSVACSGCTTAAATDWPAAKHARLAYLETSTVAITLLRDEREFIRGTDPVAAGTGLTLESAQTPGVNRSQVPFKFSGSGAPGSISGSSAGDTYWDTTGSTMYDCQNPSSSCTSVGAGQWVARGGGGSSGAHMSLSLSDAQCFTPPSTSCTNPPNNTAYRYGGRFTTLPESAATRYLSWTFRAPASMPSTITFGYGFHQESAGPANVRLGLQVSCFTGNENPYNSDTPATVNTESLSTVAVRNSGYRTGFTEGTISASTTGCAGKVTVITFARYASDALDTYGSDLYFLPATLSW